jgi:manganese-dependent inorganic pyrophosphatase
LTMAKTYIFGHKNPDTDAISSAIIMAEFEQLRGL